MSVQAVILETGETIIADITEAIDKAENKSLGYKLLNPFVINLSYDKAVTDTTGIDGLGQANDAKIDFTPWCPLADVREFRVEHDFCRVIYEAHGKVVELYINAVSHWNEYNVNDQTVETEKTVVSTSMGDNPFSPQPDDSRAFVEMQSTEADGEGGAPFGQTEPPTEGA